MRSTTLAGGHIRPGTTLGDLMTSPPALARELERPGLDYGCGGDRSLAETCAEREVDALRRSASCAPSRRPQAAKCRFGHQRTWATSSITSKRPTTASCGASSRACRPSDKVVVHGDRHPELPDVRRRFEKLATSAVVSRSCVPNSNRTSPRNGCFSNDPPVGHVPRLGDNSAVGASHLGHTGRARPCRRALAELRRLTDGYQPPTDGCASYRACYAALADLEAATHRHVHKENNLLFPAVVRWPGQLPGVLS